MVNAVRGEIPVEAVVCSGIFFTFVYRGGHNPLFFVCLVIDFCRSEGFHRGMFRRRVALVHDGPRGGFKSLKNVRVQANMARRHHG